jgi:carboxynorspermidine decarboxylase
VSSGLRVNHEHSGGRGRALRPGRRRARGWAPPAPTCSAEDGSTASTGCTSTRCVSSAADALERALDAFEAGFGEFIDQMKWVNFGGGHHITRPDYDVAHLVRC